MDTGRKWHRGALILYGAMMMVLLFHRELPGGDLPYLEEMTQHLNLRPFRTIGLYLGLLDHPREVLVKLAVINLAGNVVLFLPLGYLLPAAFPRLGKFWKTMLLSALIIAAVEVGQLVTLLGTCDIDDGILNLLGAGLGYGAFRLVNRKPKPAAGE